MWVYIIFATLGSVGAAMIVSALITMSEAPFNSGRYWCDKHSSPSRYCIQQHE